MGNLLSKKSKTAKKCKIELNANRCIAEKQLKWPKIEIIYFFSFLTKIINLHFSHFYKIFNFLILTDLIVLVHTKRVVGDITFYTIFE